MILKASQRGGAKQLGLHLLKTEENEHVEIHEISGFVADDLMGAMKEAHALSLGTKCRQPLFSVSLNPPATESVRVEVFENACKLIEDRMQRDRQDAERKARSDRLRKGVSGIWDRLTGRHSRTRSQNEMEAFFGLQRDRAQRHDLVSAQLKDRKALQRQIVQVRGGHAEQLLGLYRDAARYSRMVRDGQQPEGRPAGPAPERPTTARPTGRDSRPRGPGLGR